MTNQSFSDFQTTELDVFRIKRRSLKRIFDVSASLALLIILAPVFASIALAVFVLNGGPILYGHRRIGKDGAVFRCWKFRTMVLDADKKLEEVLAESPEAQAEWARTHKLKNDPRIIPGIGNLLRRTSLDELPQIFNVISGEMSLVGPRPVVEKELEYFGAARRHYLSVRPGLTGPWQVGERSDGCFASRVQSDRSYVENWSFAKDVMILLRTAGVPFRRNGAY
ncbi:MAG: sugar transferase [Pseudomonadota bacterium]